MNQLQGQEGVLRIPVVTAHDLSAVDAYDGPEALPPARDGELCGNLEDGVDVGEIELLESAVDIPQFLSQSLREVDQMTAPFLVNSYLSPYNPILT
jgi:hypothetical protein